MYKIGEFAKLIGKTVGTLQRWDRENILKPMRTPTGRRFYTEEHLREYKGLEKLLPRKNVGYCRVSTQNQKNDLTNQKQFMVEYCKNAGIVLNDIYEDFGSGLNYKRKCFNKILSEIEEEKIDSLIITFKDRFVRFGYEWFENFCLKHGTKIIVLYQEEKNIEKEMVDDLISIIHVFSCRAYGLRKYKEVIKNDAQL